MDLGIIVPQGVDHEYDGWDPVAAWTRSQEIARHAEKLGFESIWVYDHFHTDPTPVEEITFEAFTLLTALGVSTRRVKLGHLVMAAGYRNPALLAKMASTLDVITGGRIEVGLGAGWKQDEYVGYGYDFPPTGDRLAHLSDCLAIISELLSTGRSSHSGARLHVQDAINVPRGLQRPRVPILVGGNGPVVTWRLAARFADELNLDGLTPEEVNDAMPVIADRCVEIDRDPASLRVSVHLWGETVGGEGGERIRRLARYRELGVSRVIAQLHGAVTDLEVLQQFRADGIAAGARID